MSTDSQDEYNSYSSSPSTSDTSESGTELTYQSSTSQTSSRVGTSLSIRDSKLIDLAARGMSFEDIAEEIGADPVVVARRIRMIIGAVDQWSALEMSKIIMLQMQDVMATIKQRMEADPYNEAWADTTVKTLKTVSDHYMKMRELALKETEMIGDSQLRGLKLLMESAYTPMRQYITDNYPEVNVTTMDNIFINSLREAHE